MELRVEKLCKAYHGEAVLSDVSFTAGVGVTCIMAPSGTGKTTLLRLLLGLERADSGTISGVEGCRWAAVFQEDRLLEHLDAMGNLRFALGSALDEAAARGLLAELGLADAEGKPVREYSGGMKRRLALARALLAPADALLLDEPFTGLDEENRTCAMACIRRASAEKCVLLVTHEETDAAALGAEILRL
ncbi:MAG: ATP-binding cassette domain-containing protein [Ruminococcaceae bacterium]|nr:ATP-binding cassette domain-containing protein [Oscillospiraceae bacterium]